MAVCLDVQPLTEMTDEDLLARWKDGDGLALEHLLVRYRRVARAKAGAYFLVGADSDDIEQEGLIGLYKAARDFRPDRESSFGAFANLCVTRQVVTAIKAARRQKHEPLNSYVSISEDEVVGGTSASGIHKLLDDHRTADPADEVVAREQLRAMRAALARVLSALEIDVLRLYVQGQSYQQISVQLGRPVKSIDNAMQRMKRKLGCDIHEPDMAVA